MNNWMQILFLTDLLSHLTEEEKRELFSGIDYDENANEAALPKEVLCHCVLGVASVPLHFSLQ